MRCKFNIIHRHAYDTDMEIFVVFAFVCGKGVVAFALLSDIFWHVLKSLGKQYGFNGTHGLKASLV